MITNTDCTIFKVSREDEGTVRLYIPAVMWQGKTGISVNAHGEETADRTVIYIPSVDVDVSEGDYISRGKAAEFSPGNALRIMSVKRCDYGSPYMQHIRLEAV